MNKVLALDTVSMTLLIIFGVLFVIGGGVLLYFLLLRKRALVHQIRELDRKYEYLHSLLSGQDAQYLKRIEYIAEVNLLYGAIHEKHANRYRYLKEDKDAYVGQKLDDFKDAIYAKRYSQVIKELPDFKKYFAEFEEDVNRLNNDLLQIIRPEEECNHLIHDAKENLRLIKQEYEAHQKDLVLLKKTYEEVFKYVDSLITQFNQLVEQANYEEATHLMPSIQKVLGEVDNVNKVMPILCLMVNREVPQKITDLENDLKRIGNDGYPVQHIVTPQMITAMRNEVKDIADDLKRFSYKNAKDKLDAILKKIDDCSKGFGKERDDRKIFEQEFNPIYSNITTIEKNFIKLCNSIPKIKAIYIINEEKAKMRNKIQNHINLIGISKRSLDNSIHSSIRQPFSVLLNKTLDLKKETQEIEKEMSEFKNYLSSLKEDVEKAHGLISKYYYRLRKAEKIIKDAAISSFKDKYQSKIDEIYSNLEEINTTSQKLPIDVEKINNSVSFIIYQGESVLNQIEQDYNMLRLAESAITYLNGNRQRFAQLNTLTSQTEKMFFDGEFEKAYNNASDIIKHYSELEN